MTGNPTFQMVERPRILFLEDTPFDKEFYTAVLSQYWDVDHAINPVDGFIKLAQSVSDGNLYDGILTDFTMPDMNGGEFVHRVRGMICPQDTAEKYFNNNRSVVDAIHRKYHFKLGINTRPILMYSDEDKLNPYLTDGSATAIIDKQRIAMGRHDDLVKIVAQHLPYNLPHQVMAADRRTYESGLIDLSKLGTAERHYDKR